MPLVHLLTGGPELAQCRIACGAREAVYALRQPEAVTCRPCLDTLRRCTAPRGTMPERQLQELVRQACGLNGWLYYHTHRSQHSPAGFPDVIAVRGDRLLFAELKRLGQAPTPEQAQWLETLRQARTIETYLWTPDDIPTLLEVLR